MIKAGEPIIDDDVASDVHAYPHGVSRGYEPRDYNLYPQEMFSPPSDLQLIPQSDWSDLIKHKVATKSQLSDIRDVGNNGQPIPCLDQDGYGYCWSHSTTHGVMVQRAVAGQPYIPLSAFAVAAIIKRGRNQGGWCGLSAEFIRGIGVPSQALWPQGNANIRLDTPEMRANCALHKITEDFVDLTRAVYDQNLTFQQLATCLLCNIPCPVDFNWWGHSVLALDLVEVEPGDFGIRILNSWYASPNQPWGVNGTGILRGTKRNPNGAIAIRSTTPSVQSVQI